MTHLAWWTVANTGSPAKRIPLPSTKRLIARPPFPRMRILEHLGAFQKSMLSLGPQRGKSRRQEVDRALAGFGLRVLDFLGVLSERALDVDSMVDPIDVHLYPKIEVTTEMVQERRDLKPYVGRELTVSRHDSWTEPEGRTEDQTEERGRSVQAERGTSKDQSQDIRSVRGGGRCFGHISHADIGLFGRQVVLGACRGWGADMAVQRCARRQRQLGQWTDIYGTEVIAELHAAADAAGTSTRAGFL